MGDERDTTHDEDCPECTHHWFIDAANSGLCRKCGESKQFPRSWSAASIQKAWRNRSTKV